MRRVLSFVVPALVLLCSDVLSAQRSRPDRPASPHRSSCTVVCTPTVTLMPGVIRSHLDRGPLVRSTATGVEERLPETSNFEIIAAVTSRTSVPRLSVYGTIQWLPNATAKRNPFTLYTASELGDPVRANAPTLTAGASVSLVEATQTAGWWDLAANVGDLFSHAARPDDRRDYTHKLDLALATHLHAFAWSPPTSYVHRLSVYALLDYVATGLARRGDEVPQGRVFMTDARPLALIAGLAIPLTPADR